MPGSVDIENPDQLLHYLRRTQRIAPQETPVFTNLAGGVSNRTVLITRPTGESWVLKQALPKLRVKVDWFSDPRRIEREALGIQRLSEIAPGQIPQLIFLDADETLLAMQAVPQPHENWKAMLMAGNNKVHHVFQFAHLLARIHLGGWELRDSVAQEFDDRSFFESLRLEPYYLYSAQHVPAAAEFLGQLVADTRTTRYTLVHGDYSPKNILIYDDRLILLDHEVIHFGDGTFDIGFAMAHFLSKAHHLREHWSLFRASAQAFWWQYQAEVIDAFDRKKPPAWESQVQSRAMRHTLACLLARCVGRSPLEYLSEAERQKQCEVVVQMMQQRYDDMHTLIHDFVNRVRG